MTFAFLFNCYGVNIKKTRELRELIKKGTRASDNTTKVCHPIHHKPLLFFSPFINSAGEYSRLKPTICFSFHVTVYIKDKKQH